MRDDRERLLDVMEAITQIEKYTKRGVDVFRRDELIQNWMVRHLQILGEAARGLSKDLRERHPEVPWSDVIGMRHVLVHDYFGIDLDIVWRVVSVDLPELRPKIAAIVREWEERG